MNEVYVSWVPWGIINVPTHAEKYHEGGVLAMILILCMATSRNYVNACVGHHAMKGEGVLAIILLCMRGAFQGLCERILRIDGFPFRAEGSPL